MEIALKISWIQRIQQNSDAGWKAKPERLLGDLGGLTFLSHCRYDINLIQLHNLPPFYRSVLKYWQVYRSDFTDDNTQIQNEIIWNNSNILITKARTQFSSISGTKMESYAYRTCLMLTAPFYPSKNSNKNWGYMFPLPRIMDS